MILVVGGAYQGKLDYVKANYAPASIFDCGVGAEIDFSAGVVNSLHKLILAQIRSGIDPLEYFREYLPELKTKILVCDDISNGVVPVDAEMRQWREAVGRCMNFIASEADEVIRLFCGIGSRIK